MCVSKTNLLLKHRWIIILIQDNYLYLSHRIVTVQWFNGKRGSFSIGNMEFRFDAAENVQIVCVQRFTVQWFIGVQVAGRFIQIEWWIFVTHQHVVVDIGGGMFLFECCLNFTLIGGKWFECIPKSNQTFRYENSTKHCDSTYRLAYPCCYFPKRKIDTDSMTLEIPVCFHFHLPNWSSRSVVFQRTDCLDPLRPILFRICTNVRSMSICPNEK